MFVESEWIFIGNEMILVEHEHISSLNKRFALNVKGFYLRIEELLLKNKRV